MFKNQTLYLRLIILVYFTTGLHLSVFRPELWLSFFQNGVYPFVIKHGELEDGSMRKSSTNGGLRIAMFDYQSV